MKLLTTLLLFTSILPTIIAQGGSEKHDDISKIYPMFRLETIVAKYSSPGVFKMPNEEEVAEGYLWSRESILELPSVGILYQLVDKSSGKAKVMNEKMMIYMLGEKGILLLGLPRSRMEKLGAQIRRTSPDFLKKAEEYLGSIEVKVNRQIYSSTVFDPIMGKDYVKAAQFSPGDGTMETHAFLKKGANKIGKFIHAGVVGGTRDGQTFLSPAAYQAAGEALLPRALDSKNDETAEKSADKTTDKRTDEAPAPQAHGSDKTKAFPAFSENMVTPWVSNARPANRRAFVVEVGTEEVRIYSGRDMLLSWSEGNGLKLNPRSPPRSGNGWHWKTLQGVQPNKNGKKRPPTEDDNEAGPSKNQHLNAETSADQTSAASQLRARVARNWPDDREWTDEDDFEDDAFDDDDEVEDDDQ